MILLACALCVAVSSANPAWTWTLPIPDDSFSFNDQITALTAQGLANRDYATIWFIEPVFWTYPAATTFFPSYLADRGFVFSTVPGTPGDICALLNATGLQSRLRGLALYDDTALDATRWLAVTSSALEFLLPVTRAQIAARPCLAQLAVIVDYARPAAYNWTSNVEAYAWGSAHLLPSCSVTAMFSAGHSFADAYESVYLGNDPAIVIGIDGAVAQKMFAFNLSPDDGKYPTHAAAFRGLIASLSRPGVVPSLYGWAEPEPSMTMMASQGGGAVLCDAAPDLSFWFHVAPAGSVALPYNARGLALEDERVYVSFQTNEGDTPKFAAGKWTPHPSRAPYSGAFR